MSAQRILAVLSAILLVGSVAIATIASPLVPLGEALYLLDEGVVERLHVLVAGYLTEWTWSVMVVPLLVRPAWLVPAAIGLICAGMALSLPPRKPAARSRRRSQ